MRNALRGIRRNRGQGLSEYGLVLGLIAVIAIAALASTGDATSGILGSVSGAVAAASNPCDFGGCANTCQRAYAADMEAHGGQGSNTAYVAAVNCIDVCISAYLGGHCEPEDLAL